MFLGETVITEEKKKPLFEAFDLMNGFLEKTNFVAGDKITLADLAILASISGMIVSNPKI